LQFLLWYASSMNHAKRKVSVSLDEDLVEELERAEQNLSAQVNQAVREELGRRRRERLLVELLDQLDAEHGPVDEQLVEKYAELLR
jgi:post-segregation antitoxin (ccd killing protein)